MYIVDAIQWAVKQISDSLEHEYYTDANLAREAARAMTVLSGQEWIAQEPNEGRIWVVLKSKQ